MAIKEIETPMDYCCVCLCAIIMLLEIFLPIYLSIKLYKLY